MKITFSKQFEIIIRFLIVQISDQLLIYNRLFDIKMIYKGHLDIMFISRKDLFYFLMHAI